MEKASSEDILQLQRILHRYDPEETGFIALPDLRKALAETGRFESLELNEVLPEMEEVRVFGAITEERLSRYARLNFQTTSL